MISHIIDRDYLLYGTTFSIKFQFQYSFKGRDWENLNINRNFAIADDQE